MYVLVHRDGVRHGVSCVTDNAICKLLYDLFYNRASSVDVQECRSKVPS
jgi:hypothetical protein